MRKKCQSPLCSTEERNSYKLGSMREGVNYEKKKNHFGCSSCLIVQFINACGNLKYIEYVNNQ